MELIYTQIQQISTIHLDCNGRLRPSVVLYFAQEAATGHCRLLGTDWETLQKKGLFWALIRTSVEIHKQVEKGETITVETWPMPTSRTAYPRCTVAYDSQGQKVFTSISLWVLMDIHTRAMVLPGKSGVTVDGVLRGIEPELPRSYSEAGCSRFMERTVRHSQLDQNGHMNNTKYMDWVDDVLPAQFHREHPVQSFSLCYMAEVLEGQQITLGYTLENGGLLAVDAHRAKTEDGTKKERVFCARVQF